MTWKYIVDGLRPDWAGLKRAKKIVEWVEQYSEKQIGRSWLYRRMKEDVKNNVQYPGGIGGGLPNGMPRHFMFFFNDKKIAKAMCKKLGCKEAYDYGRWVVQDINDYEKNEDGFYYKKGEI
jgi:hypothetical protein